MPGTLMYHITTDDLVLSLRFMNPSRERIENVTADISTNAPDDASVHTEIFDHYFDEQVYCLYAAKSHAQTLPAHWDRGLDEDDLILTDTVINSFRGVIEEWEERGEKLNWYKKPSPGEIAEVFQRVEWGQPVPKVSGELMSELLCKHPLPNANHRTAVAFVRTYLQSVANNGNPEFPPAGNYEGKWFKWAESYIYESKRLLLLWRKPGLLNFAKECGVTTVSRKGGIQIDLKAHELSKMDEVSAMAKNAHRNRCVQFSRDLIKRSGHEELLDEVDDGKQVFVDRLRGPI